MRERKFIEQNQAKWQEVEQVIARKGKHPERLMDLFVQVTDDLSYSRTFYPNRSVRVYLNGLAQQLFYNIYRSRRRGRTAFVDFWQRELPLQLYHARRELLLSALVFLGAMLIGVFSSHIDAEFLRLILGDGYVEQTLSNIEAGDPMAIYKKESELPMSLRITLNNLSVALLTFMMGILYAVGTLLVLLRNGVMLGAFHYFFYDRGLLGESLLTVYVHGSLEIPAIILAGAAGLAMGKGMVFPDTYSRLQAFQMSARRGLFIFAGIVPIIVVAGFVEGFLTRYTEVPALLRLAFILFCLGSVLWYVAIWPRRVARQLGYPPPAAAQLAPQVPEKIDFQSIKGSDQLFREAFTLMRGDGALLARLSLAGSALFCAALLVLSEGRLTGHFQLPESWADLRSAWQYFDHAQVPGLWAFQSAMLSLLALVLLARLRRLRGLPPLDRRAYWSRALQVGLLLGAQQALLLSGKSSPLWFLLTLLPSFVMLPAIVLDGKPLWQALRYARLAVFQSAGESFVLLFTALILFHFFALVFGSSMFYFYVEFLSWNIQASGDMLDEWVLGLFVLSGLVFVHLFAALLMAAAALYYFSLVEMAEAPGLKAQVRALGRGKTLRGLRTEED